jgi:restriction endonuclease S subunit
MIHYWISSARIKNSIYIPKYYNPEIHQKLQSLESTHDCFSISELVKTGIISLSTGDEIGKSAYGTGDIPFVRTSDIFNWEIKSAPKQGVSRDIYEEYALTQDVREGDILLVRDGTYLIGNSCFMSAIDKEILYQSHILKIRVKKTDELAPEIFFLALNSDTVQSQIRSVQFTADIIDTLGQRFEEIVIPIPQSKAKRAELTEKAKEALRVRIRGKAFIKQSPVIIEQVLATNSVQPIVDFLSLADDELAQAVSSRTITAEFGEFESVWLRSDQIRNSIFLPKYYDPLVERELEELSSYCEVTNMEALRKSGIVEYYTGVEIGKMAYDTGNIPFIRTSDFSNWEIGHEPKQGISEEIYEEYADKQDVRENDILLVRDGTYLIGSSCIVTSLDTKSLFSGGLYKIRVKENESLDPFLLLGLLNSFIVKRQIRTKQFTRDVIDTIGNRIDEVYIPVPKSKAVREAISDAVRQVVSSRIQARNEILKLSEAIC